MKIGRLLSIFVGKYRFSSSQKDTRFPCCMLGVFQFRAYNINTQPFSRNYDCSTLTQSKFDQDRMKVDHLQAIFSNLGLFHSHSVQIWPRSDKKWPFAVFYCIPMQVSILTKGAHFHAFGWECFCWSMRHLTLDPFLKSAVISLSFKPNLTRIRWKLAVCYPLL